MASTDMETGEKEPEQDRRVLAQLRNDAGDVLGSPFDLPIDIDAAKLKLICNALLQMEESTPYAFYVNDIEIVDTLEKVMTSLKMVGSEKVINILYQQLAVFKVRAVSRCSSTLEGHTEAIISAAFSPSGLYLASGSGDCTVRFWDVNTETPRYVCKEHTHWILCIAWSPDGNKLASGCKNGQVIIWDPAKGTRIGKILTGHKQWITALAWRPLNVDAECRFVASASKDATIRIWDTILSQCKICLSGHQQTVSAIRWGGTDLLYSASQDRTIKVWRPMDGILCRTLLGHGHWVNTLALSTDYAIRTGAFDPAKATTVPKAIEGQADLLRQAAQKRYDEVRKNAGCERMVSGSDDFTMFLWEPEQEKKPIARLTGHQQLINEVRFSPDARLIASASFDKSVKLWDGKTGKYLASLRGHVNRVYQVSWSADSRLLCSGSSDSTLKVWDLKARKLLKDLPGHSDEIYAVDWSPDGQKVVSGGKDRILKIWRT